MSINPARRRAGAGQTLAIFAILLPVLIGAVGLGLDTANLFLQFRDAQTAADLASLAGARRLPATPAAADYTAAISTARTIASNNGYGSGVTVNAPYVDRSGVTHANDVEVLIDSTEDTFFLPIVGVPTMDISVRAVAGGSWTATSATVPAIFAGCDSTGGTSCPDPSKALEWSGSNATVIGGVVSNTGLQIPGSNNSFTGGVTYGTGWNFGNNGSGNVYNPPAAPAPRQAWPVTFVYNDFLPCTYTRVGKLELKDFYQSVTSTTKTLYPGVYCATGSSAEIILGDQYVTGNVTLVSQNKISLGGSNFNLTAYHSNKVVLWANGTDAPTITIAGSFGNLTGIVYARRGQVEISGSSNTTIGGGAILADRIKMGGQNITIDSNGLNTLGPATLDWLKLYE